MSAYRIGIDVGNRRLGQLRDHRRTRRLERSEILGDLVARMPAKRADGVGGNHRPGRVDDPVAEVGMQRQIERADQSARGEVIGDQGRPTQGHTQSFDGGALGTGGVVKAQPMGRINIRDARRLQPHSPIGERFDIAVTVIVKQGEVLKVFRLLQFPVPFQQPWITNR